MAKTTINAVVPECHGSSWRGARKGNSERVHCQVAKISLGGYAS